MPKGVYQHKPHSPESREAMRLGSVGKNAGDKNPMKRPEVAKKVSDALTGRVFSEEHRNKLRIKRTPEQKHNMSLAAIGVKKGWRRIYNAQLNQAKFVPPEQTQEYLNNGWIIGISPEQIRKVLAHGSMRPNRFETTALLYLNSVYDNKFVYTGDGSLIVGGKSADAYSKELNMVALFHGLYYHWGRQHSGIKISDVDKENIEKKDSVPFLSAGYKVVFVWEDESRSNNLLIHKVYESNEIVSFENFVGYIKQNVRL